MGKIKQAANGDQTKITNSAESSWSRDCSTLFALSGVKDVQGESCSLAILFTTNPPVVVETGSVLVTSLYFAVSLELPDMAG